MKPSNFLTLLAITIGIMGCSRIEEAAMPVADKINAAYPVSTDVKVAQELVASLLAEDAKALESVKAMTASRMAVRALTCSKDISVGRFDSVASVKARALAATCFQDQDSELLNFLGIRAVGALLVRPVLRPFKPAGPIALLPRNKLTSIYQSALARDAGVGVMVDGSGNGVVVEIPGSGLIANLPHTGSISHGGLRMSPNGRVVVIKQSDQAPVFIDAETGNRLWTMSGNGSTRFLAWLPEVGGFLIANNEGNVLLADGVMGSMVVHPQTLKGSSFAAAIAGSASRVLVGTARESVLLEHTRTPAGIAASSIKQFAIEAGAGITSGQPVPMGSGRLVVFPSSRDIGWLDVESGESGTWRVSPMYGPSFAKLDERHLMIDSVGLAQSTGKTWSFDIEALTVAPVESGESRGMLVDIGDRVGFMRRSSDAWFGDKVTAGDAQPLNQLVAEFEVQLQLLKLQQQTERDNDPDALFERPGVSVDRHRALVAGLAAPGLADVPANAEVHMVGVYEGRSEAGSNRSHTPRNVLVTARSSSRPMILALSSYEPVNWKVSNTGARIAAVLLSGYHPSSVSGVGNVPVLRIGSTYAYTAGSREYAAWRQSIVRYTAQREISSFQGSYSGSEFSVGGR